MKATFKLKLVTVLYKCVAQNKSVTNKIEKWEAALKH